MSLNTLNGIEYLGAHIKVFIYYHFIQFKVPGYREKSDGHIYYRIVI